MVSLPEAFIEPTRRLMGEARFARFLDAFYEEAPASIRLNPLKTSGQQVQVAQAEPVPWCHLGHYLAQRPNFTFDPLLHAGCYYVQEAASMFVHHVLQTLIPIPSHPSPFTLHPSPFTSNLSPLTPHPSPLKALDLCAAPGGKSTAMLGALPADSLLYSNEPVRNRAQVLSENLQKWGGTGRCIVTNNYPRDYRKSRMTFDVVLCDVPCSGEGMFRKDPGAMAEWSPQNVERCQSLQRDIVSDAWQCLRPGGILIYSTCTFNTRENEENVRWMLETLDAEPVSIPVDTAWGITGSLLDDFQAPVYRFIPGLTRGEGLFMVVLHKAGEGRATAQDTRGLNVMAPSEPMPTAGMPTCELDYAAAMAYLRREAITLPPHVPRGVVAVTFRGAPLGCVKNIGSRANNLYPKEWRIKSTHVPADYQPILLF